MPLCSKNTTSPKTEIVKQKSGSIIAQPITPVKILNITKAKANTIAVVQIIKKFLEIARSAFLRPRHVFAFVVVMAPAQEDKSVVLRDKYTIVQITTNAAAKTPHAPPKPLSSTRPITPPRKIAFAGKRISVTVRL